MMNARAEQEMESGTVETTVKIKAAFLVVIVASYRRNDVASRSGWPCRRAFS